MQDNFEDFQKPASSPTVPTVDAPVKPARQSLMLTLSAETDKLFEALAKAQAETMTAAEDSENPHFKSTYANLASVWLACRAALSKFGVSITQWPIPPSKPNHVALLTRVSLGAQWAMSGMEMPVGPPHGAQQVGSALTYLRRYMLAAVAGVAPDDDIADDWDDDGNAAQGIVKPQGKAPPPKAGPKVQGPPSEAQLKRLFTVATTGEGAWTKEQLKEYMGIRWKITSTKELTRAQYDALVDVSEKKTYQQACASMISEPKV